MVYWNNIRKINGNFQNGFEEFVCQLARKENISNSKEFIRKGNPDGGLECYWELNDESIIGWQAKYFTKALSTDEWKQITKSFMDACKSHQTLQKFIIAIPVDPSDAPVDKNGKKKKTMLQRSKEHITKWKEFSISQGLDVEIEFLWSSDMINKIQEKEYEGFREFWFNELEFTDSWFNNHIDIALENLGDKYTSNVNVEPDNIIYFNCMGRDDTFKDYFFNKTNANIVDLKKYLKYLKNSNSKFEKSVETKNKIKEDISNFKFVNSYKTEIENRIFLSIQELNEIIKINLNTSVFCIRNVEKIIKIIRNFNFEEMNELDINQILKLLNSIEVKINKLRKKIIKLKSNLIHDIETDLENLRMECSYIENITNKLKFFFESDKIQLINNPYLLIKGEAGIGKSFLFGNIAENRDKECKNTILLLGHQFNIEENPEITMMKELGIENKYNFDDFLDALECKAQIQETRIFILIDAINEGKGLKIWNNYFNGFVKKISKRKWIGFAISIRDIYDEKLKINDNISNLITKKTYYGFQNNFHEAIKKFFTHYNIQYPNTPLLNPEFQNPLFLRLFCETLHNQGYKMIPDGMQGISKIFDSYISSLNEKLASKLDFSDSINIINKILEKIIRYEIENEKIYLKYETAYNIVMDTIKKNHVHHPKFLDYLIEEGILIKNISISFDEEIVGITFQRLNNHLTSKFLLSNIETYTELKEEFQPKGLLYKFIEDKNSINYNKDLIDMLSIHIPEKYGRELYEIIPKLKNNYDIISSFVSSLKWRNYSSIRKNVFDYINQHVLKYKGTFEAFLELIIMLSPIEEHILNANFSHEFLFKQSLENRDSFWTTYIHDKIEYDTPLKYLVELGFSEKRLIYSKRSIELSSIMISWFLTSTNIQLRDLCTKSLINLLKDDISLLLYLLKKFEGVNDPYISERLFAVAYGSVLMTNDIKKLKDLSEYIYNEIFDKKEVYTNILLRDYARNIIEFTLFKKINLNIEIDKIRPPYKSKFPEIPSDEDIKKYRGKPQSPQNMILDSMQVEHTRDGDFNIYGDFGRYTFQWAFDLWENKVNYYDLMNIAIKKVFDMGYDENKHGEFDEIINRAYSRNPFEERIGKKYQWIALYELLAQISDKYPTLTRDDVVNENEIPYLGPWQEHVRNIDPTFIKTEKTLDIDISLFENFYNPTKDLDDEWITCLDLPDPKELIDINLKIENEDFNGLTLEGHFNWKEKAEFGEDRYNRPYRTAWYQIKSYIVPNNHFKKIFSYLKNKNFSGRRMPKSKDFYQIFNKEFYRTPSFDYYHENGWDEKGSIKIGNETYDLIIPSLNYHSADEKDSLIKVSKTLFDELELSFGEHNSSFYSKDGSLLLGLDTQEFGSSSSNLVFRKDYLLNYLETNDLKLIFTVLGEKIIIQDRINDNEHLDFSGVYYFDNKQKIKGNLHTYSKFYYDEISGSFLGIVKYKDNFSNLFSENGSCYFDENNLIGYYLFKDENLDILNIFKNKISLGRKIYNSREWNAYSLPQNKEIGEDSIDLTNILKFAGGYLFTSFENGEYYFIVIKSDHANVNGNLTSGLFKKYIKPLLNDIYIHKKTSNFFNTDVDDDKFKEFWDKITKLKSEDDNLENID